MTAPDQPWCGAELLPHAKAADGTPAPVLCELPPHYRGTMHYNSERGTYWQWQDAEGSWIR